MGLKATMEAMRTYLASGVLTGIDTDNCVVENEAVFNDVLLMEDDDRRRAVMIGYHGIDRPRNQKSEFGGSLITWQIRVGLFFLLWGDVAVRAAVIQDGYDVVDEFFNAINDDSTLGDLVMDSMIVYGDPPMVYTRQQMNEYFMLTFIVEVKENIY